MSDKKQDNQIAVIIALIGMTATLGAAFMANWSQIFQSSDLSKRAVDDTPRPESSELPPDRFPSSVSDLEGSPQTADYRNCDNLILDLREGKLNGSPPIISQNEVKRMFPCYTGETEEVSKFNHGGGVFSQRFDFYFYTYKDFIEVRSDFDGEVLPSVFDTSREDIESRFGEPQYSLQDSEFYATDYGCLRLTIKDKEIEEIGIHYRTCDRATEDMSSDVVEHGSG